MRKCYCPDIAEEEFYNYECKEFDWSGKSFYQVRVPMVAHFPMAPELKIPRVLTDLKEQGLTQAPSGLIIFHDGMLVGSLLIEVEPIEKRVPNVKTMVSTKVIAKSYKGPKHLVPKALKSFNQELAGKGIMAEDFYFWFLSCKLCNKKEPENKTIIFAKV